jgi:hypothetical protein
MTACIGPYLIVEIDCIVPRIFILGKFIFFFLYKVECEARKGRIEV